MKTKLSFCRCAALMLTILHLGWVTLAAAPAVDAARPVAKDNTRVETEPPKSVFVILQEGRDPFFPKSNRLRPKVAPTPGPVPVKADIHLKGISGGEGKRLAILNNNTFGQGETGDVMTPTGRVRIRCLQIKADSVIIEVGPERRELRMRSGF